MINIWDIFVGILVIISSIILIVFGVIMFIISILWQGMNSAMNFAASRTKRHLQ